MSKIEKQMEKIDLLRSLNPTLSRAEFETSRDRIKMFKDLYTQLDAEDLLQPALVEDKIYQQEYTNAVMILNLISDLVIRLSHGKQLDSSGQSILFDFLDYLKATLTTEDLNTVLNTAYLNLFKRLQINL